MREFQLPEPTYVNAGGYRIATRVIGERHEQRPTIVGVHGLGLSGRSFSRFVNAMQGWTQIVLPDMPGFGESRGNQPVLDVESNADVLLDWLEAMNLDNVVLFGHSFGCQVAAHMAAKRPDLLNACVLLSPTVEPLTRKFQTQFMLIVRDLLREPISCILMGAADYLRCGPYRIVRAGRVAVADHIEFVIPQISVPTLVVRGTCDTVLSENWIIDIARMLPIGETRRVPDAAHIFQWSHPDIAVEYICTFIEDLQGKIVDVDGERDMVAMSVSSA